MSENFIPLSIPNIGELELRYVTDAVKSQWVSTAGASITELENRFVGYLGAAGACACQSGTAGLHLCLRHFGVGAGDIVLVPTLTFIATINAVMYQSATPVFFDCDEHLCLDAAQVRRYLENDCVFDGERTIEKASGVAVKAIIPVHVFGDTCELDPIIELAEKYRLFVIEDATESLGTSFPSGSFSGRQTGTVGHAGVFSFNGNKLMTTGGGGMVVSDDLEAIGHISYLSKQAKDDEVYFVHNEFGYNYRMTNLQAALGLGQFERLDEFIEAKKRNYATYSALLASCAFGSLLDFRAGDRSNHWFYSFLLREPSPELRDRLIAYLSAIGIQSRPIWKLCHTQKPFADFRALDCTTAQSFYDRTVNLPCSTGITLAEIERVCGAINEFFKGEVG